MDHFLKWKKKPFPTKLFAQNSVRILFRSTFPSLFLNVLNEHIFKIKNKKEKYKNSFCRVDLRISFRFITSRWPVRTLAPFWSFDRSRNPHQKKKKKKDSQQKDRGIFFSADWHRNDKRLFFFFSLSVIFRLLHFHRKWKKKKRSKVRHTTTADAKWLQYVQNYLE